MTLATAQQESGTAWVAVGSGTNECAYFTPVDGPDGIQFMVAFGRVAAIDVTNPDIRTRSGLGVGTTSTELLARLGDLIEEQPNAFDAALTNLVFVPADESDANQRIIFSVDDTGTVVTYRSGQVPEVFYSTTCQVP
jgi:hypothetical protein